MKPVDALLAASRRLGADPYLVLQGGGNSSVKFEAEDFRGRPVQALAVKASGAEMASLTLSGLSLLDLEALLELRKYPSLADDALLAILERAQLKPGPRASIETTLHAFLPAPFVLHTHADSALALSNSSQFKRHMQACFGTAVASLPYQKPGFGLSLAAWRAYDPGLKGILLEKHGLVTWGQSADEAFKRMQSLAAQAARYVASKRRRRKGVPRPIPQVQDLTALLPALRGALSHGGHQVLVANTSPLARTFSLRQDTAELCAAGPVTPDHLLLSPGKPVYRSDPSKPTSVAEGTRIVVLKGLGFVAAGKDAAAAAALGTQFWHSIRVREAAHDLGGYRPISAKQSREFATWPLETYKLSLAPQPGELSGKIAVVTGAARGIGKACAQRLAAEGAHVALLDLDLKAAQAAATGLGERGLAIACDITDEAQVRKAFAQVVSQWGGLDILVNNAGLARCAPVDSLPLKDWEDSFAVNARGSFLCAREAAKIFKAQALGGAMVFVSSKNVTAPGKDFAAYSASKSAQTQLAKVLAIELAPWQVRVNCVTPDGVFEDSRLWDGIIESRAKAHGISPSQLQQFYVNRNLLKRQVSPADVAEAVLFLSSERASKTTGTLLPVDGGVKEAFPR